MFLKHFVFSLFSEFYPKYYIYIPNFQTPNKKKKIHIISNHAEKAPERQKG